MAYCAAVTLDADFLADCLYEADAILFDEILEIDREQCRIRVRMPTHAGLPLTRHQRVDPLRHPRHVNGGLMIHMTGMVAMAHAYYLLDMRHADGWTGYGGSIRKARYRRICSVDRPVEIDCRAMRVKRGPTQAAIEYEFSFSQDGAVVFDSTQLAMYVRVADEAAEQQRAGS